MVAGDRCGGYSDQTLDVSEDTDAEDSDVTRRGPHVSSTDSYNRPYPTVTEISWSDTTSSMEREQARHDEAYSSRGTSASCLDNFLFPADGQYTSTAAIQTPMMAILSCMGTGDAAIAQVR